MGAKPVFMRSSSLTLKATLSPTPIGAAASETPGAHTYQGKVLASPPSHVPLLFHEQMQHLYQQEVIMERRLPRMKMSRLG